MTHADWMARAVDLSRRGYPAPNPHVGCVLVRDGAVVGEGWHEAAGMPHAEAAALAQAGDLARGADAYVTLEPCRHHGRTPPCSEALIQAGVKRVWIAALDPYPTAAGGAAELAQAGIEVQVGLLAEEAAWANRAFLWRMRTDLPYVVLKMAVTLDGFAARLDGTSKWITGEEAREEGHRLRAEMGCVLVGPGTAMADDPELTARIAGVTNQPWPAVLDPDGHLTGREKALQREGAKWLVREAPSDPRQVGLGDDWSCRSILAALAQADATGVLVEGGPRTIRRFLVEEAAQELHLFRAPILFGEGLPWAGGAAASLANWTLESADPIGRDLRQAWTKREQIIGTILPGRLS